MSLRRNRSESTGHGAAELLRPEPFAPTESPAAARPAVRGSGRVPRERIERPVSGRGGTRARGHGWSPVPAPLSTYLVSTQDAGGLFPFLGGDPLPAVGARLGYDAGSGAAVHLHPAEFVLRGVVTNPNLFVTGEPGRGKTSLIAGLGLRLMAYGARLLVAGDVKGEYTPLLRAIGVEPVRIGDATNTRLNALDTGPLAQHWPKWTVARQRAEAEGIITRWSGLLAALAAAQGHVPSVTDDAVLATVLRELLGVAEGTTNLRPVTVPAVHRAMANPGEELWRAARFATAREFLDHTRAITDAIGNLCAGPLAGLFDAESTVDIDWTAPAQSLDLSALAPRGDRAVAIALTCLGSWSSLVTGMGAEAEPGRVRLVVRDEVWRQLRLGARAVQAVDADLRLSRASNTAQILIAHKPSDLLSVGHAGSQETAIAQDLAALCSTKVLFGQTTRVAGDQADLLGLTGPEQDALTGWATGTRGRALLKLDAHPGIRLQGVLTRTERALLDTQAALRPTGLR